MQAASGRVNFPVISCLLISLNKNGYTHRKNSMQFTGSSGASDGPEGSRRGAQPKHHLQAHPSHPARHRKLSQRKECECPVRWLCKVKSVRCTALIKWSIPGITLQACRLWLTVCARLLGYGLFRICFFFFSSISSLRFSCMIPFLFCVIC